MSTLEITRLNTWKNVRKLDSKENTVSKFVFEKDNAIAESVLYGYPTHEDRTVVCCSTQSGCPVGCRFCGAGDSFVRNLTAEEIVDQVEYVLAGLEVEADAIRKLQVMFMSMGEPMLNYRNLEVAMETLYALHPNADLLVSTSGPRVDYAPMRELSRRIPKVGLQFSVHESTDEARNLLVPFKAKLNLEGIAREGDAWAAATGRRPFFNYCAHEGNTSVEDANRLAALFNPEVWEATVSVVCERDESVAGANFRQKELAADFMSLLLARGYSTRMFDPAGQDDIGGGCGQLWFVQKWMRENPDKARPSAGRSRPVVHAPHEDYLQAA